MNKLLLRTPKPHALESYRGYLLRLAETNGLSSPTPILKLAGVNVNRIRCAKQPVEVLSIVTGHDVKSLAHLPLVHPISNIQQVSGHAVSKGYSIISKSKICPCCINEQGFAPAYWDLIAVQGCYKHQQSLISSCPRCNSDLSWIRPGLLTCECGADLSKLTGSPISQDELEFLKIIDAKFNGLVLGDSESTTGLPFKHLTQISLAMILGIVHTMGSMNLLLDNKVQRALACTHKDEVKYALEILKDWPNNFFKFLRRVGEVHGRDSLQPDSRYSFFTQRFFKRGYPQHQIQFLKEAFIDFGTMYCEEGYLSPASQTTNDANAKSNMNQHLDNGYINTREAEKLLGMPSAVFKRLVEPNLHQIEKSKTNSFHVEELESLKQRILDCQLPDMPDDQLISIGFIMHKSFRSLRLKTAIIENILNQSFPCFGHELTIDQIQIRVSDLEALTNTVFAIECDWLNFKQASALLHCDKGIIIEMLKVGYLDGSYKKGVNQIRKDSILLFKQEYMTLQQLSSSFKLGVKALKHLCHQKNLKLLPIKGKFNVCQYFVQRSDFQALASHVKEYYLNHKKLAYKCRLETINLTWAEC